ncbi:hypothetical protein D3C78_1094380 [compost metagenome]
MINRVFEKPVPLLVFPHQIMLCQRGHNALRPFQITFAIRIGRRQVFDQLQQAAHRNRRRRRITQRISANQRQIPVTNTVLRKSIEEIVRQSFRQGNHRVVAGINVAQQKTVNPPRLAARPAGVVGVALLRVAVTRRTGFHIHIIGVER